MTGARRIGDVGAFGERKNLMLLGYVSDERYVALSDVLLEFEQGGRSIEARSRATGAVHALSLIHI